MDLGQKKLEIRDIRAGLRNGEPARTLEPRHQSPRAISEVKAVAKREN